jgi:hypothetical protein
VEQAIAPLDTAKIDEKADRVKETTPPLTPVMYETVRRNGEQEMARPPWSLGVGGFAHIVAGSLKGHPSARHQSTLLSSNQGGSTGAP